MLRNPMPYGIEVKQMGAPSVYICLHKLKYYAVVQSHAGHQAIVLVSVKAVYRFTSTL